jgi:hypothetical protein
MNKFAVSNNDAVMLVNSGKRHLDSASINFVRQSPAALAELIGWELFRSLALYSLKHSEHRNR